MDPPSNLHYSSRKSMSLSQIYKQENQCTVLVDALGIHQGYLVQSVFSDSKHNTFP